MPEFNLRIVMSANIVISAETVGQACNIVNNSIVASGSANFGSLPNGDPLVCPVDVLSVAEQGSRDAGAYPFDLHTWQEEDDDAIAKLPSEARSPVKAVLIPGQNPVLRFQLPTGPMAEIAIEADRASLTVYGFLPETGEDVPPGMMRDEPVFRMRVGPQYSTIAVSSHCDGSDTESVMRLDHDENATGVWLTGCAAGAAEDGVCGFGELAA